ncbi:HAD family hydrolase [bacterium]|nr:MAG: HAD family hydrolase [bacterium]
MKKQRALFIDRDGILNHTVRRDGKCVSPRTFKEFRLKEGIKEFTQEIKKKFLIIVVTNQPDIARGFMKTEDLDKMHHLLLKDCLVDKIFVCPHDDKDNCSCRKPKAGMLIEAAEKWQIDLKKSFIVGDSWKDIGAGKNAGCKTILWQTDYNQDTIADFYVTSFREILKIIKTND